MSPLFLPISSQWGQHTVRQKEEKEKEKHKSHIRQSSELTELGHLASCSSHARIKKGIRTLVGGWIGGTESLNKGTTKRRRTRTTEEEEEEECNLSNKRKKERKENDSSGGSPSSLDEFPGTRGVKTRPAITNAQSGVHFFSSLLFFCYTFCIIIALWRVWRIDTDNSIPIVSISRPLHLRVLYWTVQWTITFNQLTQYNTRKTPFLFVFK